MAPIILMLSDKRSASGHLTTVHRTSGTQCGRLLKMTFGPCPEALPVCQSKPSTNGRFWCERSAVYGRTKSSRFTPRHRSLCLVSGLGHRPHGPGQPNPARPAGAESLLGLAPAWRDTRLDHHPGRHRRHLCAGRRSASDSTRNAGHRNPNYPTEHATPKEPPCIRRNTSPPAPQRSTTS